jgi:hypothetical protein
VIVTCVPTVGVAELGVTMYRTTVCARVSVTIVALLPVTLPVVAVTICDVPGVAEVVKLTVARPFASVFVVGLAKLPPFVLVHVTVWPAVRAALPFASTSCALIVTAAPACGRRFETETRYFVAGPATVVTFPLVPVRVLASVAVKLYVFPATVLVVNTTVAMPFEFVEDVGVANDPPVPVLLHATVTPGVAIGVSV